MFSSFIKRLIPRGLPWAPNDSYPESLHRYMSSKRKPPRTETIDGLRFVVFDTETTGLDLSKNRLLSIAGVALHGFEVRLDDAFSTVIRQPDVGGATAAVVHGFVSSDLADGATEEEAVLAFLAFADDSVLVAHHAAFDRHMLDKAISKYRGAHVWNPVIDTAQLAKRVEVGPMSSGDARGADDRKAYRLDELVDRYGIEVPERHTAGGDALATALLFQRLLKKAKRRGIGTLGELLR